MTVPHLRLAPVTPSVRRGRMSDRVFAELASAIRDLRLTPGRLLSESELAQQLHVSRTPLREAIARLDDAGLVQVLPQIGTLVARIRMRDVEEARFVRESLETAAFEEACAIESRDVQELRELIRRQERAWATNDFNEFFVADEALHAGIFAMSGYPGAWVAVQRMKLQLDRLRRLSLPDGATVEALIIEHRAIVDALEIGDATQGRKLIQTHARQVLSHVPRLRRQYPDYFVDQDD